MTVILIEVIFFIYRGPFFEDTVGTETVYQKT